MTPRRLLIAALVALFAAAPLLLPNYYVSLMNYIGLYAIVCVGLVLLTGVAGLTSFGQAAFVGLGAYATALLTTAYGWSGWATLPVALALTAIVALFLGWLTIRLAGHYLVLGTIAWGIGLYYVFGNWQLLGGYNGMGGVPALSLFGVALDTARGFYPVIWLCVGIAMLATANLLDSRPGRAIRALRSPVMAESFGVPTGATKIVVFVYAALLAGLAGWLHANYLRFVNPGPFGINASVDYLFMAVIGGTGHLGGAIVGAAIVTLLKSWLQDILPKLTGSTGNLEIVAFGVLVLVMLQRSSGGAMAALARVLPKPPRPVAPLAAPPLLRRVMPPVGEQLLEVRGVTKRFGGLVAVNNIDFALNAGEIVGLIGPNGAGKSTLFNLMTGVLPLSTGQVWFRGERVDRLGARHIMQRGLARTFQHVLLRPDMSALENVALGAHRRTRGSVVRAAMRLDRDEEARLLFEAQKQLDRVGIGQLAQTNAGALALGQQRILEIARALAADPVLLLLDEPAAGLRHSEKQELALLLRALRSEGVTVLVVEHDMDFVMNLVDRLVVVDFGEKIAAGSPGDVRANPAVIEAYLGGVV